MNSEELTIRDAAPTDADAMGHLHVRAWQRAYRGVMPDGYLDGLDPQDRVRMWHDLLASGEWPLLVAELSGRVVGFAAIGAERAPTQPSPCGELFALNLDPDQWGRGIGRRLLSSAEDRLADLGYDEAVLWVVPENERARALYESAGWRSDGGTSTEAILGITVTDIRLRKQLSAAAPSSGR